MASSSEAGGYKSQICYFWSIGNCMYGHECRFSHGIEEQRRHLFPHKSYATTGSAQEATAASTNSSIKATPAAKVAATTSSTNSPIKVTLAAEAAASTNSSIKATPAAEVAATTSTTNSPIKATLAAEAAATVASTISNIGCNWSPQDDGIEIKPLPSSTTGKPPLRDEVDAHLEAVLYGPKIKEG